MVEEWLVKIVRWLWRNSYKIIVLLMLVLIIYLLNGIVYNLNNMRWDYLNDIKFHTDYLWNQSSK